MISKGLGLPVLAMAVCMPLLISTSVPAEAKVCRKTEISRLGDWRQTWSGARYSAMWAWKRRVANRYGTRYWYWLQSRNRHFSCWSNKGRERCRAYAVPCRSGS